MPRVRSPGSDDSDGEMDGMAEKEQEHQKLVRQYRIMEGDRKAYCLESQDLIQRQRAEIKQLKSEKKEAETDLALIDSMSNQNKDEKHVEGLGDLGEEKDTVDDAIKGELKKHEELQAEIREWEKKMRDQSKNMGGVHMSQQHTVQVRRNVSKLENQLQQANNKFASALETNKTLREEIDSLRVERERFENLYKKLDKDLQELRQEIGEEIDQSTQAYDARDEAQAKIMLLKEKADKDLQQHNAEMKELVRIIDHDRKLREFMNTKCRERQEDAQLVEWRERKEAMEAEKKKASQVDSVESYEAAFERIKEMTGEEDIDSVVNKFIEVEDRNFALFNYVNELNNKIDILNDQIGEIRRDIDNFESQGVELESQRRVILKDLEVRQDNASKSADDADEKSTGVKKILDQLKAGVESLFNKINCDRSAIDDMLGAQAGVTDQNMIQYLGIIEERTNQLLMIQTYVNSQKDPDDYLRRQPTLLGEGPNPASHPLSIIPPSVGDEYESDGSDGSDNDKPLTQNELLLKAMKSVKKREAAAKKEGFQYDLSDAREKTKKKEKAKGK